MIPYSYPHTLSEVVTTRQWSCGKVMFTQVSVCHSVQEGSPCDHYSWMHWTSLYRPPSPTLTPDIRPSPTQLVTSGDHHWRSVQTCSLEKPHTGTDIWWPKHVWLESGRYASSENAFFLFKVVTIIFSLLSLLAFSFSFSTDNALQYSDKWQCLR